MTIKWEKVSPEFYQADDGEYTVGEAVKRQNKWIGIRLGGSRPVVRAFDALSAAKKYVQAQA